MNSNILKVILHIGALIKTLKDVEQAVADLVHGQYKKEDVQNIINDVLELVQSGAISIPGMAAEDVAKALTDLTAAL